MQHVKGTNACRSVPVSWLEQAERLMDRIVRAAGDSVGVTEIKGRSQEGLVERAVSYGTMSLHGYKVKEIGRQQNLNLKGEWILRKLTYGKQIL